MVGVSGLAFALRGPTGCKTGGARPPCATLSAEDRRQDGEAVSQYVRSRRFARSLRIHHDRRGRWLSIVSSALSAMATSLDYVARGICLLMSSQCINSIVNTEGGA